MSHPDLDGVLDRFPQEFSWGASTSAYQIEGGRWADGKGESIWDRFSDEGRIPDSGDTACDHYNRWQEDVALMADLGVNAYRFSVAWTRVLPDGDGDVNTAGLGFYDRLVDGLLAAGITPWPTLYHWDLPQSLQDRGGWAHRATVDAFARYAEAVASVLGDRVRHWTTHNEPWVAAYLGHRDGIFAPGLTDARTAVTASHHILLSHGRAVPVIRTQVPDAVVGIVLDCRPSRPASPDPADVAAQRHFDGFRNRWFFDPVFGRGYPEDISEDFARRGLLGSEVIRSGDLDEIATPLDFLGLNYYTSIPVRAGREEEEAPEGVPGVDQPEGFTEMGWRSTPDALTAYLGHLNATYSPPQIVITENGASFSDGPGAGGTVDDRRRVAYLAEHIGAVGEALAAGAPVTGYFVWSLLDNLEWAHGYSQRFGLVWVDHASGRRIPKDSYHWYRRVIRQWADPR